MPPFLTTIQCSLPGGCHLSRAGLQVPLGSCKEFPHLIMSLFPFFLDCALARYAGYILTFTTLAETELSAWQVLEWYRLRWQIELVFKRFKQIAQLGHLPKNDPQSARAWLYGKMLVALLVEKLIAHARSVSPWGYPLRGQPPSQPMA